MESTVNEIIGKLVVPNQQMRWSPHGDVAAEFYTAAALGLLVWWIEHDFCHDDAWLTGLYRKLAEQSRQRILDAATEVATERGYDGTTISLVSKKSGLPPTSIYWHFVDKDDLIAAVIDRSYQRWLAALELPGGEAARTLAFELGAARGQGAAGRA